MNKTKAKWKQTQYEQNKKNEKIKQKYQKKIKKRN